MSTLEIDKVKVKSEPEEFIAERVKLNPWKKKVKTFKILTPNKKLLTRLAILSAQIKAERIHTN